jgi:hypothetical protein
MSPEVLGAKECAGEDQQQFTPHPCQYVRYPRLLKRCALIAVGFRGLIPIYFLFNYISKLRFLNVSVILTLKFWLLSNCCDIDK